MRKKLIINIFAAILLLLFAAPAFALEWENISWNPSPFLDREYTRQHWTRFKVEQKFLQAYNFHYDAASESYPCSPAWYKENGYEKAGLYMSSQSGCEHDVPIIKTTGDNYTRGLNVGEDYTLNNPARLRTNKPPADIAGGIGKYRIFLTANFQKRTI